MGEHHHGQLNLTISTNPPQGLGVLAYAAYRDYTGGVSLVTGSPLPDWADLTEPIRQAWEAAARAVATEVVS